MKSKHGGLGKSFYIQRMTEMFPRSRYIIIPIHGPVVTADIVMEQLKDHGSELAIFHIDIAPSVSNNYCITNLNSKESHFLAYTIYKSWH